MSHVTRFTIAVAAMVATLAGCRDVARQLAPDATTSRSIEPMMSQMAEQASAPLVFRTVAPQATDPAIDRALADHYVWLDTTARGNPKLLVFMPGANNVPASWQLFEQEAARLGYHVIGLSYQNDVEVVNSCGGSFNPAGHSLDPDCSGDIRLEVLTGDDSSSIVNVTPANSIDNRLAKLLGYLADQYPAEGWSRFLDNDGTPKWSQVAVSGQSQGAGQAALIGKLRHVDRVVMFSGPPEQRVPEQVDPWISIGETPAAKYFALFHDQDHLVVGIRLNLSALDMERFGAPVQAEVNEPPYGGTHILFTDLRPTLGYDRPNPHQSTARDNNTPLDANGTPLLRDAWRYFLGEPRRGGSEKTVTLNEP